MKRSKLRTESTNIPCRQCRHLWLERRHTWSTDILRVLYGYYRRTKISTLYHEVLDNTVELGALVAKAFGKFGTILLDASRKRAEVLYRLRDSLVDETLTPCLLLSTGSNLRHRRVP